MKFYCCIDDTDNIDSVGTGTLAEQIRSIFERASFGKGSLITRHQLYIHPDIPYTSHNSSMCFSMTSDKSVYPEMIRLASEHLVQTAADGSDPGLCLLMVDANRDYSALTRFGIKAKKTVLTKEDAWRCAEALGVHLSEHGGTGQGIIGALAGVGLRMSGDDGEVRGALKDKLENGHYPAKVLLDFPEVFEIRDMETHRKIEPEEEILLSGRSKTVWYHYVPVLFVHKNSAGIYETCTKQYLRNFGESCESFVLDVKEEQVSTVIESCYNCRYRRWTAEDFTCLKGIQKINKEKMKNGK